MAIRMRVNRALLLAGMIGCCACASGCEKSTAQLEGGQNAEADSTLVWTLPEGCEGLSDNAELLNEKLKEDGYGFEVSFQFLPYEDYKEELTSLLKNAETDIAFLGYGSVDPTEISVSDMANDGDLLELSSYLKGEDGQALYSAYTKTQWDAAQLDSGLYYIPSEGILSGMRYFVFNRAYFSEEDIRQFDGSPEQLLELVRSRVPDSVEYPLVWDVNAYTAANWCGYQYQYYAVTSLATGKAENPFENEEIRQFILLSNQAKEDGILKMISDDEGLLEIERERSFGAMACVYPTSAVNEESEDVYLVQAPYSLYSLDAMSTGICAKSDRQNEALTLLSLLHTNEEYANLLLYGEEGTDYQVIDGYAYDMAGGALDQYVAERITGIYDLAVSSEEGYFPIDTRAQKQNFLSEESLSKNVLQNFIPDYQNEEIDYEGLDALLTSCLMLDDTIYTSSDMDSGLKKSSFGSTEEWLEAANEYYVKMGGDVLVNELNEQIDAYLNR